MVEGGLRLLQLVELEILSEFLRICEKYELHYFLVGGTLLGAVRDRGFIPWDDDIDVAMFRNDYERFANICNYELSTNFFYQSSDSDHCYFLTYAKLRKNKSEVYEDRFCHAKFHKGIFIDIFPLDYCPAPGKICNFLFNILAVINYRGQIDSGEKYHPYKEILGKIGYAVLKPFSPRTIVKVRKVLLHISKRLSKGDFVASYSGAYGYRKEVFPACWFGSPQSICFEHLTCSIPQETKLILIQEYGADFMQPKRIKDKRHLSI